MTKYFITGISGFVAGHFLDLLDSLGKSGITVLGVDTAIPEDIKRRFYKNITVRLETLNLLDYQSTENVMVGFQPVYVVHLASFSSVSKSWQEPLASFMNNTNIFLNICEIIRKNNIKCRLLSIGSSEEYGNVPDHCIPIKESVPLNPINPYAVARVSQEMLSQCYVSSYKLDVILTRSFNHIGPGQRDMFVIPSFVKQILNGIKDGQSEITLFAGAVSIVRDFLDVRDVVRAYYLLLEKGITGELYNVCAGNGYSLMEIIDTLAELLRVTIITKTDITKIRPNDNKVIIGDNTKIKEHIGWQPEISFIQSLQDMVVYWKNTLGMRTTNYDDL
jgi:GDP-4-dehydro-6-deoxy-D-mannose reductase